jgi:hypothetical protein
MHRILSTLALLLVVGMANAKPVTTTMARQTAATFLGIEEEALQTLPLPFTTMHLFAIDGGGFIITSADDRMQPVLGYSHTSNFSFPIPDNLRYWLECYDTQIRTVMDDPSACQHPEWRLLASRKRPEAVYDTTIGPLLTTTWNQLPYYNSMCPSGAGGQTLTGCVATAMGQVMKYWNWPDTGAGSHSYIENEYGLLSANFGATTYDWEHMPNYLNASSTSTEVDAVATLLYHCGVATNTDYGTYAQGGSGAIHEAIGGLTIPCAENALRNYFKYSPALRNILRVYFTADEWAALLKNEIDHLRPILYTGTNPTTGGHEFVCDGYDTTGFFHFNWGWSGENNGFFSLGDINSYNAGQMTLIGIEPDTLYGSTASCTVTAEANDPIMGTVIGSGTYMYRDTITVTATANIGYAFAGWSNGVRSNPYTFLAHGVSLQAIFVDAPASSGDTLAYLGATDQKGMLFIDSNFRAGTRFPPEMLQGRDSITGIEIIGPVCTYIIRIFHGGDTAPERLLYEQSYTVEDGFETWHHAELDQHQPIAQDSSLWITVQLLESAFFIGAKNTSIPDDNWISTDSGDSWIHLTDYQSTHPLDDLTLSWLVRCITSSNTTGTSELLPQTPELTIYPNPTSGTVSIMLPESNGVLHIYDATGRLVECINTDTPTISFDAGRFPTGLYLLRHTSAQGSSMTRLFVR